jgi:hypothetical protein
MAGIVEPDAGAAVLGGPGVERQPPNQNRPGAVPSRARTAMRRDAFPSPTSMKVGGCPVAAELVMRSSGSPLFE